MGGSTSCDGSLTEGACLMVFAVVFGNTYLATEPVTAACREGLEEWQAWQDQQSRLQKARARAAGTRPPLATRQSVQALVGSVGSLLLGGGNTSDFVSSQSLLGNPLKAKSDSHFIVLSGSWRHGSRDHVQPVKGDQLPQIPSAHSW